MNTRWRWITIVGYVALVVAVVWSLFKARDGAIEQLSNPESVAEWQTWREDVRLQQADHGQVARRVPKSAEPPALVLMRDYFAVSLTGALVFSSALYWVTVWLAAGILSAKR